ncbi:helix-turn-helix domain-containing protein [Aliarcobacter butzleri]|uniref:helix-turn-helix domain-containing protein n=1 Tax=Aliarcobacter butzleri TaxID=28197 RepID=UPI00125EF26B|nr:helix-turn-helix domain-containing protein [Aliarcobacter butzleri]MCG3706733.1 helix-turn-helix domain-containing protein [Aliarcobacter butzleri]
MNENFNYIKKKTKFTQISNICLYDDRLSLDSRGLMCILLSYPDNWKFYNINIAKISGIGIDKLNKLYRQLEKYGYLKRTKKRDDKGKFRGFEFEISDEGTFERDIVSESTSLKTPLRQKSGTDKPVTAKSVATNINITNTITNDYQEKMNQLNKKLLQKQLNKDIQIQKLENLAVSRQNQIDF